MSEESLAISFYFYLQVRLKESATMICAQYLPVKIMSLNFVNFSLNFEFQTEMIGVYYWLAVLINEI